VDLKSKIRLIPDFPHKGILFRDITTLIKDGHAFKQVIDILYDKYKDMEINKIVSIEARGYLFGGALAYKLGCGIVPVRKPGKLPGEKIRCEYELEYGKDALEIHKDAINPGERVLIFDDLLATGGTALAACKLVEQVGGKVVGIAFLIELTNLNGREKLKDYDVFAIIKDKE